MYTHSNVKYCLKPSDRGLSLSIWYNKTSEYIFEKTVQSDQEAKDTIDRLLKHSFIKESARLA